MADITLSRTIAADARAVWDVLADFGSVSSWAGNLDHSCILRTAADGPVGTTRRVQAGRVALVERIVEFEPVTNLAYDIEGLPAQLGQFTGRWSLRPAPDGSTNVTLTTTVAIGSRRIQRAAERLVARLAARRSEAMLAGLAARWEAPHG